MYVSMPACISMYIYINMYNIKDAKAYVSTQSLKDELEG